MTKQPPNDEEGRKIEKPAGKAPEYGQSGGTSESVNSDLEQEELLSLFNLTIDMLCVADINGRFRSINKAWETVLGYKQEDLLSKPYLDFVHPDDVASTVAEGQKLLQGQRTIYFENRYRCQDGSYKWLAWTSSPNAEKGITFAVARDITEKKAMEEALKRTQAVLERRVEERTAELVEVNRRLEEEILEHKKVDEVLKSEKAFIDAALDSQTDTFFVFNPTTGKAIRWNKAFSESSGYSDEEIQANKAPESYYSEEDLQKAAIAIEKISQGEVSTIELSLITKDGRTIPTEYKSALIMDEKGSPKHIISVGRDISERKKAEEERFELEERLHQAQKMEAIGTLAGGIAHDFNNILGVIMGNTELAMHNVPEWNPASDNLLEVQKASLRAKDMVKQVLSFSRQAKQEMKPICISTIIKESIRFIRASIPTTIEIRQNFSATDDTILGNSTQINQIIMNLCTNAKHATGEDGGCLEVGLRNMDLNETDTAPYHDIPPGKYIVLIVSDTGHGIESDIIERIFDPYFTTKEIGEGSGMGLSVVHGIVQNHNGAIRVYSTPGKGTTFNVFFPLIESHAEVESTSPKPPPGGTERILFVDDEDVLNKLGKQMLQHLGYEVTVRTNGIEALEAFKAQPDKYDLLITDMTMPKMTGKELAQEILRIRPDFRIILCTGFSEMITEDIAKKMGIKAFVMKPLGLHETAVTIRQVLDQKEQ